MSFEPHLHFGISFPRDTNQLPAMCSFISSTRSFVVTPQFCAEKQDIYEDLRSPCKTMLTENNSCKHEFVGDRTNEAALEHKYYDFKVKIALTNRIDLQLTTKEQNLFAFVRCVLWRCTRCHEENG